MGPFIGLSAAAFWNYTTLFVNTFFVSGLKQALLLMQFGHLPRPDLFISVPAWVATCSSSQVAACFMCRDWTKIGPTV